MEKSINEKLFDYIEKSPTAYHAADNTASLLRGAGCTELFEGSEWKLCSGKGYFVRRGGSSLIAFRIPDDGAVSSFMISAVHSDSPTFKIKENAEQKAAGDAVRLSVEKYGGMLSQTWFDRPLSAAGRVAVRTENGMSVRLADLEGMQAIIPSLAIHLNRDSGNGAKLNPAVDMLPLYRCDGRGEEFSKLAASAVGADADDVLSCDMFLYVPERGHSWNGYISAPRLDDLQCAFATLEAFMTADGGASCPVYCLFDNEEVGSATKQGAASTFLYDTLTRICRERECGDLQRLISQSFMVSCDNAHAVHPNHPELCDPNHQVKMNGGIVIKYNANQHYTTDAVSAGIFRLVCEKAGVPCQMYANRADMPGGATLGSIANTKVSVNTVDIGLAQLAMHSAFETAGDCDTEYMVKALKKFFSARIKCEGGEFEVSFG